VIRFHWVSMASFEDFARGLICASTRKYFSKNEHFLLYFYLFSLCLARYRYKAQALDHTVGHLCDFEEV